MKKLSVIGLFGLFVLLATGCSNTAEKTAGEFSGNYYLSSDTSSGTATLTKTADNKIKIDLNDSLGFVSISAADVEVVASANNTYNLSGSNISGHYFDNSKTLDLSYTETGLNFIFNGIRQ